MASQPFALPTRTRNVCVPGFSFLYVLPGLQVVQLLALSNLHCDLEGFFTGFVWSFAPQ